MFAFQVKFLNLDYMLQVNLKISKVISENVFIHYLYKAGENISYVHMGGRSYWWKLWKSQNFFSHVLWYHHYFYIWRVWF